MLQCNLFDCVDDLLITCAAAEVAGYILADALSVGIADILDVTHTCDDKSGDADSALYGTALNKRILKTGCQLILLAKAFVCPDLTVHAPHSPISQTFLTS